jgi:Ca2+-transporting ATPase
LLEAGNVVPADCRLLDSTNLKTQESSLTGESQPVEKEAGVVLDESLPVAERRNMVFMGTIISCGRGKAVVVETGMRTQLGRIADMIQEVRRERTPLQKRLDRMGRVLAIVALCIVAVIFALGLLRGEELRLMFMTAVSLAVAAIPEGLPAVVTIALALGAQRMLKRRTLIRKLPAVETLGSVTVICTDKTGTLTRNQMTVAEMNIMTRQGNVSFRMEEDSSKVSIVGKNGSMIIERTSLTLLLIGGTLCNDAVLSRNTAAPEAFHTIGDPTEGAIVVAAARLELLKPELEKKFPRIGEVPFDSARKRMTTVHRCPEAAPEMPGELAPFCGLGAARYIIFVKGAVDGLLDISGSVWMEGKKEPLDDPLRRGILAAQNGLAGEGLRTLGVAFRFLESVPEDFSEDALERNLTFIGMFGMIDPPRPEAEAAVKICKEAGIRPVMITGDHPLTARYIAEKLGISDGGRIVTGRELDTLTPEELYDISEEAAVYARVSPEHKLSLVRALQKRGHIVAMTGDGVNDAPALKKADIGVAMGITGVDVAKEASDMILLDDNFATIVAAVEEGRVIYGNIRKFIRYLLSCNSGELWVMLLAPFLGMPLPLLPLQILWMNLVTDGLPALALGVEPAERNTMLRPPLSPSAGVFSRGMGVGIVWIGLATGLATLAVGCYYWRGGRENWQTVVFTTIILFQMGLALATRSESGSFFSMGPLTNRLLLGAVSLTICLQMLVVYIPFLRGIFKTTALSAGDLAICFAVGSLGFWAVELEKWLIRRRNPCYR